jgi:hypothetical protein
MEMEALQKRFRDAIENIDKQDIIYCLEKGVDVNFIDVHGYTSFADLALVTRLRFDYDYLAHGDNEKQMLDEDLEKIELMKLLLSNGADINLFGDEARTALDNAAGQAKVEMVKFLLENGANPNFNFFPSDDLGDEEIISSTLNIALQDAEVCHSEIARRKFEQIAGLLEQYGAIINKS